MVCSSRIFRFCHAAVMILFLIMAMTSWISCAGKRVNLQNEDRKLSRYKDYRQPDAALLYLAYGDEDYVIGSKWVYKNHQVRYKGRPLTDDKQDRREFYRRLSEIEDEYRRLPNSFATLLVNNQGGLKYRWPDRQWVMTPVSLSPGEHTFQIQSHYSPGSPLVPTGEYQGQQHTAVSTFEHTFEPRVAYALIAFRTRDGLFRHIIERLGKLGKAKQYKNPAEGMDDEQTIDFNGRKLSAAFLGKIIGHLNAMSRQANSDKPYF